MSAIVPQLQCDPICPSDGCPCPDYPAPFALPVGPRELTLLPGYDTQNKPPFERHRQVTRFDEFISASHKVKDSRDIAQFRSTRFAPVLPEDCQVNPRAYGAELAFWLCTELARRGVATSYPEYEDWGWYIEYRTDSGAEFAVDCGNVGAANDHWLLCLRRFGRKMFGRDKPPFSDAALLLVEIRGALEADSSISGLQWLYPETYSR